MTIDPKAVEAVAKRCDSFAFYENSADEIRKMDNPWTILSEKKKWRKQAKARAKKAITAYHAYLASKVDTSHTSIIAEALSGLVGDEDIEAARSYAAEVIACLNARGLVIIKTRQSQEAYDNLLAAVKNPPAPTQALIALFKEYGAILDKMDRKSEQGLVIQQGWRPIDTAPSDVRVLLYCPDAGCPSNPERIEFEIAQSTKGGYRHGWATMWQPAPLMPLPSPPAEQGGGV